jgi:hypothetical protein
MAIDTANKRRSVLSCSPFNVFFPISDGAITAPDRRQLLGLYRFGDILLPDKIPFNGLFKEYHVADNKFLVGGVDLWWKHNNLIDVNGIVYILRDNVFILV